MQQRNDQYCCFWILNTCDMYDYNKVVQFKTELTEISRT